MPQKRTEPPGKRRSGNIDPNLIARLDLYGRVFTLKWIVDEEDDGRVGLLFGCQPQLRWMDLLALPMGDLLALRAMFDLAIETAGPVVARLDAEAEKRWEDGQGIARRMYRPPANFLNFGTPYPQQETQPDPTESETDVDTGEH